MKRQESFEEVLRSKLDQVEAEPPAFVFDRIADALGDSANIRVLPWYKTLATQRIAAAVALLLVAGTVYWLGFNTVSSTQNQLANQLNDSIRQLQLQNQLQALEIAANSAEATSENNLSEMQPVESASRLEVVQLAKAVETIQSRNMINIETIPLKAAKPIGQSIRANQLILAAANPTYIHVERLNSPESSVGSSSAIANTFTKLSSGEYLELAKQKMNDFVSKEHYLNFAIGNVEFGQTIQLSK